MTDTNHPWSWPSITAGIFVGVVAGVTATLITQWIIRLNYGDTQGGHTETTVTATSTAVATATTTVTVTADPGSSGDSSDPSNSDSLPAGQQFLVDQKSSNPKGSVKTNESPRIDGKMYPRSIRTYCVNRCVQYPSSIEYGIGSNYSTLTTTVGVDADNGDSKQIIKFNVWLIGVSGGEDKPAVTEVRKAGEKKEISVPLNGASRVRLETLYGGEDPKEAENMEIVAVWGTPILS
mgnify:FL=1